MKNLFKKNKDEIKRTTPKIRKSLITIEFRQEITDGKITEEKYWLHIDRPSICDSQSIWTTDYQNLSPRQYQDLVNAIKEREGLIEVVNEKE